MTGAVGRWEMLVWTICGRESDDGTFQWWLDANSDSSQLDFGLRRTMWTFGFEPTAWRFSP